MVYKEIKNYTVKCRLYPNKEQARKIDAILDGMRVAHNVTMYEMNQHNPMVTSEKDGVFWADFRAMGRKDWLDALRENYPIVKEVPATSLSSNNGLFLGDCQKAWEKTESYLSESGMFVFTGIRNQDGLFWSMCVVLVSERLRTRRF